MKKQFKKAAAAPLSRAEKALKKWVVKYKKKPDGTLFIQGSLDISDKGLKRLPDLSSVIVSENFYCGDNLLTSLAGAPRAVGGNFHCQFNHLTSLKGSPVHVGGDFCCNRNELVLLEHAPATVGGDFNCSSNQLTSLKGAPAALSGNFYALSNPLTSLEGAPKTFNELWSDAGTFTAGAIPKELLTSPETKARLAEEQKAKLEQDIQRALVLQNPRAPQSPASFKKTLAAHVTSPTKSRINGNIDN